MPADPARLAPLWHRAAAFAAKKHHAQQRKDATTPYFAHPARVATIVATVFHVHDEIALASAYLHDTIEDTDTDYDDLESRFGAPIADIVAALTKDMRLARDERERQYDEALVAADWRARLVKLADVYDNLLDSIEHFEEGGRYRGLLGGALAKSDRILGMTGDDPELADARVALEELAARLRAFRAAR